MTLFECAIRYDKMCENGAVKRCTELYLVDALTFTEAEARIIQQMQPFISGEFTVQSIKRTPYAEVVNHGDPSADRWYKAKIHFITIDERTAAEKKTVVNLIVLGESVQSAHNAVVRHMQDSMADYEIATIEETKVMDVYMSQQP